MKASHITAALLTLHFGLSTGTAQAAEPSTQAPLTRAEVRAELLRARAANELPSAADLYGPTLSRALLESQRGSATRPAGEHAITASSAHMNPASSTK